MWLPQEACKSMPSSWMRSRSSFSPCTLGRLETPPAGCRLTPGRLRSRLAVSLLRARWLAMASCSRVLVLRG